jgi:hypothetical protein
MRSLRIAAIKASLAATSVMDCYGKRASFDEINAWIDACKFASPAEVGYALIARFKYRPDGWLDAALPVRKFFAQGADDCDGFALMAEYICNRLGYDCSRVYVRASNDRGHVVCVARHGQQLWQVGNWQPFVISGDSLKTIGTEIAVRQQANLSFAIRFKGSSYQEYFGQ